MLTISVPRDLTLGEAVSFINRLWQINPIGGVAFDFRGLGHVEPFTMAFTAAELRRYRLAFPEVTFRAINFKENTYAAHMGFFKAFGLDHGKAPGEAQGSGTYIPLTILQVDALRQQADAEFEPVGEVIERESRRLAIILTRESYGELVDTLTFSFRELMRNVVEHSESRTLEYCAQYWPSKGMVEIAVLDAGIGVYRSLASNRSLAVESDRDALQLALLPAISSKAIPGSTPRGSDVWENSGFGLYMTSRMCGNCGSFLICSGSAGLLLGPGEKKTINMNFGGTALRMMLKTTELGSLRDRLSELRDTGFAEARSMGRDISPSVASTMLSRDFGE